MRPIESATCSCGGAVTETEPTDAENKDNCPMGCCLRVLYCDKCKTRFVLRLEAPEAD